MTIVEPIRAMRLVQTAMRYHVRITTSYNPRDWQPRPDQATVFQRADWLTPLYESLAENDPAVTPLFAEISDDAGALAFRLALLQRKVRGIRQIEFADLGMSDFNAPLLGPASPLSAGAAKKAWAALTKALPPHDLLRLTKMPPRMGGGAAGERPNPLLLGCGAMLSGANGNLLLMQGNWTDQHFGMPKAFRKELERSWRVFSREEGTAFIVVHDADDALKLLDRIEQAQRARMAELGQPYRMEDPVTAGLYRRLMVTAVPSGFAYLTALTAGEEMVAALLGLRDGENYVMTRLVHAGDAWSKVSPGRLLIHKTMELLHAQGYRRVDFSIGNYAYKRRFGPVRTPLYDIAAPGTFWGVPAAWRMRAGAALRRYPHARDTVRRLLGKPSLREEN